MYGNFRVSNIPVFLHENKDRNYKIKVLQLHEKFGFIITENFSKSAFSQKYFSHLPGQ